MRGERVEIGGVARAHGIRGEIVVVTHDPDSETLAEIESIFVGGIERRIRAARNTHKGWLVALDGVATRNDAEALQGAVVEVARSLLSLEEDDILLDDLVGLETRLADGTIYGTVFAVDPSPFQDLLIIHAPATPPATGEVERLLPLVDAFVTNIDLDAGVITVEPPEGLPEVPVKRK